MSHPFPAFIDNSALSSFKKCPTDWMYSCVQQITRSGGNIHLHFGGAFAAGLEAGRKAYYGELASEGDAIKKACTTALEFYGDFEAPEGSNKNAKTLIGALLEYFAEYPMDTDFLKPVELSPGKPAVEFTFAVPLPIKHPETGDPILYSGRFDMLAERDGVIFIEDDKTASQLGSQWMRNWLLDSQPTGYCWAAQTFGFPVAGAIFRGVSILKNGFGHAQSIVYRPQWQIDRWYSNMLITIQMMIDAWRNDQYLMTLDKHACNSYGGCGFHQLCESPDPAPWIAMNYEPRVWNPTAKGA